jgi:hypothetical protein
MYASIKATAAPRRATLRRRLGPNESNPQAHYSKYEPTILELKRKYEAAMKEKMLAGLDRDKMAAKARARAGGG